MPIFSSATTTSDFNLTEPSVTKSINEIGKRSYSNQKRRSLLQPSPSVQIKKKSSLFFFNLRLDSFLTQSNKEQKNQSNNLDQKQELHSSYLQLLRGQSKSINNKLLTNNNSTEQHTAVNVETNKSLKREKSRSKENDFKIQTPSTSSRTSNDAFYLFPNDLNKTCDNETESKLLKSRFHSPFLLRKAFSQVYNYNPFLSYKERNNAIINDLDQISGLSSTSSTMQNSDSGLSSVTSAQLLYSELKECFEKGEPYNSIENKFKKSFYAFWCLDEMGNSIFHLAAKHAALDTLKSLVSKYPDKWYVTNKLGETAMQSAIDSGNLESFKYLLQLKLDENADITQIVDHEGNSLLAKAILYDKYDIVKYLIEFYPNLIHVKNCYGAFPIHLSVIKGNMQILRLVCRESKKYINERDSKSLTPAMYAAQNGHYECLKYLLDNANAKYNKTIKSNKFTLLHLGVRSGSLNVVQYLIMKMGTSFLKCRTKEGATVYHLAAASGNDQVLEYLLALKIAKTLKHLKDVSGSTAAHDAAENGHVKCLKILHEAGLNMFEEDIAHATPYSLALKSNNLEVREFAISLKPSEPLNESIESNANNPSSFTKFHIRRLSSMLRQRRAKVTSDSPPYLYTQKLRPAPVSLPHISTITGIQNNAIQIDNEDELNDLDTILEQLQSNTMKKASILMSHQDGINTNFFNQSNSLTRNSNEKDINGHVPTRLSRYQEHQIESNVSNNNTVKRNNNTHTIGLKLRESLSSSRESTPTLIRASRSGTPTPLLQSLANDQTDAKNNNNNGHNIGSQNNLNALINNNSIKLSLEQKSFSYTNGHTAYQQPPYMLDNNLIESYKKSKNTSSHADNKGFNETHHHSGGTVSAKASKKKSSEKNSNKPRSLSSNRGVSKTAYSEFNTYSNENLAEKKGHNTHRVRSAKVYKIATKNNTISSENYNSNSKNKKQIDQKKIEIIEFNNPSNPSNAYKLLNQKKSVAFEDEIVVMDKNKKIDAKESNTTSRKAKRNESAPLNGQNKNAELVQVNARNSMPLPQTQGLFNNNNNNLSYYNSLRTREIPNINISNQSITIDEKLIFNKVMSPKQYKRKIEQNYSYNDNQFNINNPQSIAVTNGQISSHRNDKVINELYEPAPDYWDYDTSGSRPQEVLNGNNFSYKAGNNDSSDKNNRYPLSPGLPIRQAKQQAPPTPPVMPPTDYINNTDPTVSPVPVPPPPPLKPSAKSNEPISLGELITKSIQTTSQKAYNEQLNEALNLNNLNKAPTTNNKTFNNNHDSNDNHNLVPKSSVNEKIKDSSHQSNNTSNNISPSSMAKINGYNSHMYSNGNGYTVTNTNNSATANGKPYGYSTNIYVNVDGNTNANNITSKNDEFMAPTTSNNLSLNTGSNIFVTNVQVTSANTKTHTQNGFNYLNSNVNSNGHYQTPRNIEANDGFPTPPTQSLVKMNYEIDIGESSAVSPNWPLPPPPPPPLPVIDNDVSVANKSAQKPFEQTNNTFINTENLNEARQRILTKKNSNSDDRASVTTTGSNETSKSNHASENGKTKIADTLLREMKNHKLYNTQKDYILNYLDRGNNSANTTSSEFLNSRNAVRIYNSNIASTPNGNSIINLQRESDEIPKVISQIDSHLISINNSNNTIINTTTNNKVNTSQTANTSTSSSSGSSVFISSNINQTPSNNVKCNGDMNLNSTKIQIPISSYDRFPYLKNNNKGKTSHLIQNSNTNICKSVNQLANDSGHQNMTHVKTTTITNGYGGKNVNGYGSRSMSIDNFENVTTNSLKNVYYTNKDDLNTSNEKYDKTAITSSSTTNIAKVNSTNNNHLNIIVVNSQNVNNNNSANGSANNLIYSSNTDNNNNNNNNKKYRHVELNENNIESELDRVFRKRALQNQT